MKWFRRRPREIRDRAEFEVVSVPASDAATAAAEALRSDHVSFDRTKTQHPGVYTLEGDLWTVHGDNGVVYLSGEDGAVQVQFEPRAADALASFMIAAIKDSHT
jgi:hypothetical protein